MEVSLIDHMGSDLSVVNAARVSFAKHSEALLEKDVKLIEYLCKHSHWSPLSHTCLSFRVKAPLFVARQLWKSHVSSAGTDCGNYAWNEQSFRYVEPELEFYCPRQFRKQSENNKQCSSEKTLSEARSIFFSCKVATLYGQLSAIYEAMVEEGVAREQARMILPASVYTEWIWTGSLVFFARVVKLRVHADAQEEAGIVAKLISEECEKIFPHSWKSLIEVN